MATLSDKDLKKIAKLINIAVDARRVATKDDVKALIRDLGKRYL